MTSGTVHLGSDPATRGLTPLFLVVPGTAQRCQAPLVDLGSDPATRGLTPLFLTARSQT